MTNFQLIKEKRENTNMKNEKRIIPTDPPKTLEDNKKNAMNNFMPKISTI